MESTPPEKARAALGCSYRIEMDGGIDLGNVGRVALAGCDVVVAGSAVFNNGKYAENIQKLKS